MNKQKRLSSFRPDPWARVISVSCVTESEHQLTARAGMARLPRAKAQLPRAEADTRLLAGTRGSLRRFRCGQLADISSKTSK